MGSSPGVATDSVQVSVVVPVYGNAPSLRELAERLNDALSQNWPCYELLLIDDGSKDDSWNVIQTLAQADSRIKAIRLSRNFGQHPAIAAGFDRAQGEIIVLMDADLQDRPEELPRVLEAINNDIDIVYTIKSGDRETGANSLTSTLFHAVFQRITRTSIPANIGTYRAFSRRVLRALNGYPEYNVLFGPLMFFAGFNSTFVDVQRDARRHGQTTYPFRRRLSLAIRSLVSYTDLPAKCFLWSGAGILGCVLLYALAIVVQFAVFGAVLPSGITFLTLLVLLSLAITLIALGVLGSYIFRVYQEVLRRPRYHVARTINVAAESDPAPRP